MSLCVSGIGVLWHAGQLGLHSEMPVTTAGRGRAGVVASPQTQAHRCAPSVVHCPVAVGILSCWLRHPAYALPLLPHCGQVVASLWSSPPSLPSSSPPWPPLCPRNSSGRPSPPPPLSHRPLYRRALYYSKKMCGYPLPTSPYPLTASLPTHKMKISICSQHHDPRAHTPPFGPYAPHPVP